MTRHPCLAFLFAGFTVLVGVVKAKDDPDRAQPATRLSPGCLEVEIDDGTVTVKARDVTVKNLLEEIALQGGLVVEMEVPLDERVTLELDRLPMPEALQRVLRGQNFALRYVDPLSGAGSSSKAPPSKLWVFAKGPGDGHVASRNGDAGRKGDGAQGDERLVRLRLALADGDARMRLEAVSELAELGGDRATEALAAAALFDEDSSVREEAVHGLGEVGDEGSLRILEQALTDRDHRVREAVVEAVTDIGGDGSAWALGTALNDAAASVREQAVYALGEIGGETAIHVLQRALADERGFIREAAAEVLDELTSR